MLTDTVKLNLSRIKPSRLHGSNIPDSHRINQRIKAMINTRMKMRESYINRDIPIFSFPVYDVARTDRRRGYLPLNQVITPAILRK